MHVARGDASAAARRRHAIDVDAELLRDPPHRGRRERLARGALDRRAGAAHEALGDRERARHRADDGAGVFAFAARGGFRLRGGRLRRGGRRRGRRAADDVAHERLADVQDVAFLAVQLADRAGPRARHLDEGLVGLHLREDLVLPHGVAGLHAPLDELGFVHPLAEIGQDEVALVGRLLDGHRIVPDAGLRTGLSRRASPRRRDRSARPRAGTRARACSRA